MATWPDVEKIVADWDDVTILTAVIWGEARSELYGGLVAVGCVVRNRVFNPGWWGRGYRGVCTKQWQFSCWQDQLTKIMLAASGRPESWQRCEKVAFRIMSGGLPDVTLGADSYYARRIQAPYWAKGRTPLIDIGAHRFYNLRDAKGT